MGCERYCLLLLLPNSLPGHIPTQYFVALAPDEAVIVSASTMKLAVTGTSRFSF